MRPDAPKVRSDLTYTVREKLGDVIVSDEILGRYHAVGALEHALFLEMDGTQTLRGIAAKISQKFDGELRPETVQELVDAAAGLGLLDLVSDESFDGLASVAVRKKLKQREDRADFDPRPLPPGHPAAGPYANARFQISAGKISAAARALNAAIEIAPDEPRIRQLLKMLHESTFDTRRPQQCWWSFRIPLLAPDRLLRALDPWLGWLIHPVTAAAILLALLVGGLSVLINWDDWTRELIAMKPRWNQVLWMLIPVWLLRQALMLTHELTHGLTCRHYGGTVRRIGLLVRTVFFGAYCDVSSAYTFQERWKRAAVTLAGPLHNAAMLSLTILLATITSPSTQLHTFLILFGIWYGTDFLIGLLPFYKDDLYFTISEAFNAPNLFEKAVGTIKAFFARTLFGLKVEAPELLPHEKVVVYLYGTVNVSLTAWAALKTLAFGLTIAIANLRGLGAVLLVFLLFGIVGRRLGALTGFLWSKRSELIRSKPFWRNLAVGSVTAVILPFIPVSEDTVVDCRLEQETVKIQAPGAAVVSSITADEGDSVSAGQVLATLRDHALEQQLAECRGEAEVAEANVALATAPARALELAPLAALEARNRQERQFEEQRLTRLRALTEKRMVDATELSDELERTGTTEAELASNQWSRRALQAGKQTAERAGIEAQLKAVTSRCEALQVRSGALVLRAPNDGKVLRRQGGHGSHLEGMAVHEGDELFTVALASAPKVELELPSLEVAYWNEAGRGLEVRLSGDKTPYPAKLVSVAQRAEGAKVKAEARLDRAPEHWVHQASCRARFTAGTETLYEYARRRLAPFLEQSFWTLW